MALFLAKEKLLHDCFFPMNIGLITLGLFLRKISPQGEA
jgi:hypothetical protein